MRKELESGLDCQVQVHSAYGLAIKVLRDAATALYTHCSKGDLRVWFAVRKVKQSSRRSCIQRRRLPPNNCPLLVANLHNCMVQDTHGLTLHSELNELQILYIRAELTHFLVLSK